MYVPLIDGVDFDIRPFLLLSGGLRGDQKFRSYFVDMPHAEHGHVAVQLFRQQRDGVREPSIPAQTAA